MARVRRVIAFVGPARIVISLALGIATTACVAWWCELAPPWLPRFPPAQQAVFQYDRQYAFRTRDDQLEIVWWDAGPTWVIAHAERVAAHVIPPHLKLRLSESYTPRDRPPTWIIGIVETERTLHTGQIVAVEEFAEGWPMIAMTRRHGYSVYPDRAHPFGHSNVLVPYRTQLDLGARPVLPITPVFPGFLINTLFSAVPVYALLSLPACITGLRRRLTHRCPACGYSLEGLAADVCPECGRAIKRVSPPSASS